MKNAKVTDETLEWMKANQSEIDKYKGKNVAVHPKLGIVASGDTLTDCSENISKLKLTPEDLAKIVYDYVPEFAPGGFNVG